MFACPVLVHCKVANSRKSSSVAMSIECPGPRVPIESARGIDWEGSDASVCGVAGEGLVKSLLHRYRHGMLTGVRGIAISRLSARLW